MLVKSRTYTRSPAGFFSGLVSWNTATVLALVGYTTMVLATGAFLYRGAVRHRAVATVRDAAAHPWRRFTALVQARPDTISIDIKHKHLMRLEHCREQALEEGRLSVSEEDYVPAVIRHGGKTVSVKLRLKGDGLDHLRGNKWSFRVIVKNDQTLFGMKRLSLHHPLTRGYLNEWLYQAAMRREDVIALRYDFIKVTLNGANLGIYAVEEHFDKRLLEHNRRHEGPIVRFNESLVWRAVAQRESFSDREALSLDDAAYLSANVDGFQTDRWLKSAEGRPVYLRAMRLLEAFRNGELATSQVFDVPRLAKFLALSDLLGAVHGARWHNFRFYYNPVTARLEPIAFDGHPHDPIVDISPTRWNGSDPLEATYAYPGLFQDLEFTRAYIASLEEMRSPAYLDKLFSECKGQLAKNLRILHIEFPHVDFSTSMFYENARFIDAVLNPPKALHAYALQLTATQATLQLGNIQQLPLEVVGVFYNDTCCADLRNQGLILPGKPRYDLVDYVPCDIKLPAGAPWSDQTVSQLRVRYRLLGSLREKDELVFPCSRQSPTPSVFACRSEVIGQFEFLQVNEIDKEVVVAPGNWQLNRPIAMPEGFSITAGPGTLIDLVEQAMIVATGPIRFVGNSDAPVTIKSSDGTGRGIVVANAAKPSLLEYTRFEGLSNPSAADWAVSGGVTFYESDARLRRCHFQDSHSEDAINFVRSKFDIEGCDFRNISADAVDADFCTGRIAHSTFATVRNDAFDASGSVVSLDDVKMTSIGDKGISAGETSRLICQNISIDHARIGLASKDISHVTISDSSISNAEIATTAFQKKPEFGPSSIEGNGVTLHHNRQNCRLEAGSTATFDGQSHRANATHVADELYPSKD